MKNALIFSFGALALITLVMSLVAISALFYDPGVIDTSGNDLTYFIEDSQKHLEAYKAWSTVHNVSIFSWQLFSTKVLFWLSIVVSMCGIVFSVWQFFEASDAQRRSEHADELEIKTEMISLAFKSRSIASLLLFVSIGYLTLYSIFVYPIEIHPQSTIAPLAGAGEEILIPIVGDAPPIVTEEGNKSVETDEKR